MRCSKFLYLGLGGPVPPGGKETCVHSECSLSGWGFGKCPPLFGWDSNSCLVSLKKYKFVPLLDTTFYPHP